MWNFHLCWMVRTIKTSVTDGSPVTKCLVALTSERACKECVTACIGGVCGLTLHGLGCLDQLGHTPRHMLRVNGQLLLLLRRGLLQHLRIQKAPPTPTGPHVHINERHKWDEC